MDGWSVRLVAGITLTLAGAAAGRAFAQTAQKRAAQLNGLCQAIERLSIAMLERRMPLKQALAATGHGGFIEASRLVEPCRSVYEAWNGALQSLGAKSGELSALSDEDIAALGKMFERLGSSGMAEQKLLLDESRNAIGALWQSARKKADEQGKLYSTLGLLAGLAVAILLI